MCKHYHASSRQKEACRISLIGLSTNIILSIGKFIVGISSNSIAILADGVNNLTDCVSSLVMFIGFRISGRDEDEGHPYGHGRMEYISGLIVSMIIITTALSFGRTAFSRIMAPREVVFSNETLLVLLFSISVKIGLSCWIYLKNRSIRSVALETVFKDSCSDAAITAMTLIPLTGIYPSISSLDGLVGIVIAGFILWTGTVSFFENVNLLIGTGVNADLVERIKKTILGHDVFADVESVSIHDYGPETRIALIQVSLNRELPIDRMNKTLEETRGELMDNLNVEASIYWINHRDECIDEGISNDGNVGDVAC